MSHLTASTKASCRGHFSGSLLTRIISGVASLRNSGSEVNSVSFLSLKPVPVALDIPEHLDDDNLPPQVPEKLLVRTSVTKDEERSLIIFQSYTNDWRKQNYITDSNTMEIIKENVLEKDKSGSRAELTNEEPKRSRLDIVKD